MLQFLNDNIFSPFNKGSIKDSVKTAYDENGTIVEQVLSYNNLTGEIKIQVRYFVLLIDFTVAAQYISSF
jgi:hypothetical protein